LRIIERRTDFDHSRPVTNPGASAIPIPPELGTNPSLELLVKAIEELHARDPNYRHDLEDLKQYLIDLPEYLKIDERKRETHPLLILDDFLLAHSLNEFSKKYTGETLLQNLAAESITTQVIDPRLIYYADQQTDGISKLNEDQIKRYKYLIQQYYKQYDAKTLNETLSLDQLVLRTMRLLKAKLTRFKKTKHDDTGNAIKLLTMRVNQGRDLEREFMKQQDRNKWTRRLGIPATAAALIIAFFASNPDQAAIPSTTPSTNPITTIHTPPSLTPTTGTPSIPTTKTTPPTKTVSPNTKFGIWGNLPPREINDENFRELERSMDREQATLVKEIVLKIVKLCKEKDIEPELFAIQDSEKSAIDLRINKRQIIVGSSLVAKVAGQKDSHQRDLIIEEAFNKVFKKK